MYKINLYKYTLFIGSFSLLFYFVFFVVYISINIYNYLYIYINKVLTIYFLYSFCIIFINYFEIDKESKLKKEN